MRFRSTGLVNIGRTPCSELEITATVETAAYGATHNPWNLELSTAGSSGGSAAAVAAGVVPNAHGRDGGGSVRMPAACCGVVGLKPTRGRISAAPDRALGELSGDGILARSVRDVAALVSVLQGGGPGDAYHIAPLPRGFESQLESSSALRIGVLKGHLGGGPVQPEVETAITAIAETCERMRHHLVEFGVDLPYDDYLQATLDLWYVETAAAVAALSSGAHSGTTDLPMEGLTASWVERGRSLTARDVVNAFEILNHVSRRMALASGDLDVLLSATLPTLPLPLGIYDGGADLPAAWYFDSPIGLLERTTMVFNCTGQPAIVRVQLVG